jgi:glutamyl-tRNA reductase
MPILCLGVSYRRAPVELLERLAFGDDEYPKAYGRLTALEPVREGVILSTCNRVEVYAEVDGYHQGFQDLKRFLAESREVDVEDFAEPLYSHYEDHAAEHVFSVAAGLDSMVLGEPQILAQVRAAFRRAEAEGATGPGIAALFRQAVRAGRRVRAETGIGASPAAFVEAGAVLAAAHLGGLEGRSAVVVGAGTMSELAVRALRDRGVRDLMVLARRPDRAERLALRGGARHASLSEAELRQALEGADLVVSSTGATGTVVPGDAIRRAVDASGRRMFVLDLAVPRDVEPEAGAVPGVAVADIDDLRELLARSDVAGADEVEAARAVVAEETRRYVVARRAARLAPLIEALHARGERVRAAELRRIAARLQGLSEREREAVEALSRGIVRKLLHDPVVRLKDLAGRGVEDPHAQALIELFDLRLPED